MITSRFFFLVSLFISIFSQAMAQDLLLKKAPPLSVTAMLQVPESKSWQSALDGKVVVLEFWATWCTPCLANLQHLNELSDHFADSNVCFVSVTNEPESQIRQFLKKRKMNGWVGIDSGKATFKNYGVTGMPATFIIDKNGIIKYAGGPWELNETVIREIIAGTYQPERIKIKEAECILGGFSPGDDPVFTAHFNPKKNKVLWQNTIRRSVGAFGMGYKQDNGFIGITLLSKNLTGIVSFIHELPSDYRVINRSSILDSLTWDIIFERNRGYDMPKALKELNENILSAFSIGLKDSTIARTVLVPYFGRTSKIMDEKNIDFDKSETHSYRRLTELYNRIEEKIGHIVDYETRAETQYIDIFDILSRFYKMPGAELKTWLETQGITFKEEKRNVVMKVVYDE